MEENTSECSMNRLVQAIRTAINDPQERVNERIVMNPNGDGDVEVYVRAEEHADSITVEAIVNTPQKYTPANMLGVPASLGEYGKTPVDGDDVKKAINEVMAFSDDVEMKYSGGLYPKGVARYSTKIDLWIGF